MFELFAPSLSTIAIVGGLFLLVVSQKNRLAALLGQLRSTPKTEAGLTPHERFEHLYALRTWCETSGQAEAVKAIDTALLPAIVQGGLTS